MCDIIAGELIVSFSKEDRIARRMMDNLREGPPGLLSHVQDLQDRLKEIGLAYDTRYRFEFHRVAVPHGLEQWAVTQLHQNYAHHAALTRVPVRPEDALIAVPASRLSLTAGTPASTSVQATDFDFSVEHTTYKSMLNASSAHPDVKDVHIAIVDSGIADDYASAIAGKHNLLDKNQAAVVSDERGHGTAIASIIHDLAPGAKLHIFKVTDAANGPGEWDVLAALAACNNVHIVNMSLQYGLADRTCGTCGRQSQSSRSAVFERMIGQLSALQPEPLMIAAAGNWKDKQLAFPARFGDVIAVGSITSQYVLSSFSNTGDVDHNNQPHDNHYVLPGGESDPAAAESVGEFQSQGKPLMGTSYAVAYASGVAANLLAQQGVKSYQKGQFLTYLRSQADASQLVNYRFDEHGQGVLQL